MTTKQQIEWYKRDRELICEDLGITINQFNQFRRIGNDLHKLYERQCNGYTQQFHEDRDNEREQIFNDKAIKLATKLGLEVFFQTDPRGATIYLSKEPIADNNYNRLGVHCIY